MRQALIHVRRLPSMLSLAYFDADIGETIKADGNYDFSQDWYTRIFRLKYVVQ